MKRYGVILINLSLIVFVCGLSGCANSSYMYDRQNDAVDIFTAISGVGLGAKVRAGSFNVGLIMIDDRYGWRGGTFINSRISQAERNTDVALLIVSSEEFLGDPLSKARGKTFIGHGIFGLTKAEGLEGANGSQMLPYYTQLDFAVGGLWIPSVRIGINPGELLDFVFGWTTLDIFNDDLRIVNQAEKDE